MKLPAVPSSSSQLSHRFLHRIGLVMVLLLCSSPGHTDNHADNDVAQIDQLYADWRAAVERADIDAYVKLLHKDVRLLPPGAPPIVSAASYREFLGPVFKAATYAFTVDSAPQIEVMGDMAYAEYTYTIELTLKDAQQDVEQSGALTDNLNKARYFDVLRRDQTGAWQVWRHAWQAMPLAADPP